MIDFTAIAKFAAAFDRVDRQLNGEGLVRLMIECSHADLSEDRTSSCFSIVSIEQYYETIIILYYIEMFVTYVMCIYFLRSNIFI